MTVTHLHGGGRRSPSRFVLTGNRCYLSDRLTEELLRCGEDVVVLDPSADLVQDGLGTCLGTDLGADHGTGSGSAPEPSRGRLEVVEHDPEDPALPEDLTTGVDVVVHVAAGPEEESLRGLSGASLATLFALRLARVNGARLVIASLPGNADHLHADEALAAGYRSSHDVDTVLARVAECYGPGMPSEFGGVVACMLKQADDSGSVVVSADDRQCHSVCFVDDVVEGLLGLARGHVEGPVYLGPLEETTTAQLAREVARATGAAFREVARLPSHAHAAPGRALAGEHPTGWQPRTGLREGLQSCVGAGGPPAQVVDLTTVAHLRLVTDGPTLAATSAPGAAPESTLESVEVGGDVA